EQSTVCGEDVPESSILGEREPSGGRVRYRIEALAPHLSRCCSDESPEDGDTVACGPALGASSGLRSIAADRLTSGGDFVAGGCSGYRRAANERDEIAIAIEEPELVARRPAVHEAVLRRTPCRSRTEEDEGSFEAPLNGERGPMAK